MNFVNMPELEMQSGYFYILGLMGVIGLGGLYLFYRNGWFKSK
jgi:magnesium transporter